MVSPSSSSNSTWDRLLIGWVGPPAAWFKKYWIPPGLAAVGAIVAILAANVWIDADGTRFDWARWLLVSTGIAAAVSSLVDKLADVYDRKVAEQELALSEDQAEAKVGDLNAFLAHCALTSEQSGTARRDYPHLLRQFLVIAAAKSLSSASRASYYTLSEDEKGHRVLGDPVHHLEGGRTDQSSRPFIEEESPDNTIWTMLDRADTEPQVVEYPDNPDGIDWDKVSYRSYYSVPVKHRERVFGMLSVNTAEVGAISGSQRAAVLGMARAYALTLSLESSRQTKSPKRRSGKKSETPRTVAVQKHSGEG